ncbi:MAG: tRNA pseudouridine(38-40) synthase TruA [Candidatus Methanomethylicia archaeon]
MEEEKYAMKIFYIGSKYYGFVKQKDKPTIEGCLRRTFEDASEKRRIQITYASRTDRGVHAIGQTITINLKNIDFEKLNENLPEDIAIWAYCKVPKHFDARKSTIYRHYKYIISNENLDINKMEASLKSLIGIHDFRKICYKTHGPVIRRIYYTRVERLENNYISIEIIGSKFARGLVRGIVTIITKIGEEDAKSVWDYIGRGGKISMAPPENLYLIDAYYPLKYQLIDNGIIKAMKTLENHEKLVVEPYIAREIMRDFKKLINDVKEISKLFP